jgi:alkanesulfonate monooxygenase SsuD/methylene tetrahydromethanopterin reductase-like flavin-dependent oxidoreductase (luciferase family)
MAEMEFGIFSNGSRPNRPQAQAWEEDLYEIVLGDKLGFQEAWISEHAVAGEFLICKAAALTKNIKLGPGVRSLPLYHPVQVASEANTCDQLTNGRYLMGCGVGFFPTRMNERGIDPALGHDMARESLDLITQCWTSPEPFDFRGRFWQGNSIKVRPDPFQRPHPPIAVACSETPESAELAGERGYWVLFGSTADPDHTRQLSERFVAAAEAAGRTPRRADMRTCRFVYVADSMEQAKRDLRETMSVAIEIEKKAAPHRYKRRLPPSGRVEDVTFDYLVDAGHLMVGDADTVYQRLVDYYDRVGGFGVLMFHMGRDYGRRRGRARSMRLFMEKVAPRLRALRPE